MNFWKYQHRHLSGRTTRHLLGVFYGRAFLWMFSHAISDIFVVGAILEHHLYHRCHPHGIPPFPRLFNLVPEMSTGKVDPAVVLT